MSSQVKLKIPEVSKGLAIVEYQIFEGHFFGVPCSIFFLRAFNETFNETDKNFDLHIPCSGVANIAGGWPQSHIGICDHVMKVVLITCVDTSILR
jgi:hypothetical protein